MDFEGIGGYFPLILAIVVLIFLYFLRRGRKPEISHREIARGLLSEVRLNQAIVGTFDQRKKPKKLEVVSWRRNKPKLDFLGRSLQGVLSDAFSIIEDFNQQIEAVKKHKSTNYMGTLNVDKLKGPLAKSRQGLEEWLLANVGKKEPRPEYPGMFDSMFGGKG